MSRSDAHSQRGASRWGRVVTAGVCTAALLLPVAVGTPEARADGDYRTAAVQARLVSTLPADVKQLWQAHPELGRYFRGATSFLGGKLYEFSEGRITQQTGRAPYLVDGPVGDYFMRSAAVRVESPIVV